MPQAEANEPPFLRGSDTSKGAGDLTRLRWRSPQEEPQLRDSAGVSPDFAAYLRLTEVSPRTLLHTTRRSKCYGPQSTTGYRPRRSTALLA